MRRQIFATLALAALIGFAGCVYVPPVTQGNYLQANKLQQLKVGMTRKQVQYLFGEPMLANPFYPQAWHYVYYYKPGARSPTHIYRLTVHFKNDQVASFDTSRPISKAPGSETGNRKATPHPPLKKESRAPPEKAKHPRTQQPTGGGQEPQPGSGGR